MFNKKWVWLSHFWLSLYHLATLLWLTIFRHLWFVNILSLSSNSACSRHDVSWDKIHFYILKSLSFYFLGITSYLATSTENFEKKFFSSNVLDELPIRPFWGRFVEKKPLLSSCLAPASGVTKFTKVRYMILVTLCCVARVRLRCSAMVLHKNFIKWFVKNHSKPLKHEFSNQSCER